MAGIDFKLSLEGSVGAQRIAEARQFLEAHQAKRARLATVLRDYAIKPITSKKEMGIRANLDGLLDYYSYLELALCAGYIRDLGDEKAQIKRLLNIEEVQIYYTEYYPTPLVAALKARLEEGNPVAQRQSDPRLEATYLAFLSSSLAVEQSKPTQTFLSLAEDFIVEYKDWTDLASVLEKPERIAAALARLGDDDPGVLELGLLGLLEMVQFFETLERICEQTAQFSDVLRWGYLHYWEYWVRRIQTRFIEPLEDGLQGMRDHRANPRKDTNKVFDVESFPDFETQLNATLNRLKQLAGTRWQDSSYFSGTQQG